MRAHRIGRVLLAVVLLAVSGSAAAYRLEVHARGPLVSRPELIAAANRISGKVGAHIPDDQAVVVLVQGDSKALRSGDYLYLYRIQLRRLFSAGAPYPYRGWLPEKTTEYYGIGDARSARRELDKTLTRFFTEMKSVDPARGIR